MQIIALQLDLARQKESLSFIKSYADFAKQNGYNTMILYLENAVRTKSAPFFHESETYSVEEMCEIVSYMEGIGLDVIPAFENLGHMEKFLEYDELKKHAEGKDGNGGRGWGNENYPNGTNVCVSDEEFRNFADEYIKEVASLFHSEFIHMGLDEVFEFAVCKRCEKELETTTKETLFYHHVMHCRELVKSLGRRMMMWDDFFEYYNVVDRLPRDIVMCCWSYGFIGDEILGHWTGRVRRDPLRIYDTLGFNYLFCTWAPSGISSYRLETLTAYAEKYRPMGAVMTMWECSNRFYLGSYPQIAYAGALWNGRKAEKAEIYKSVLEDSRAAELVAAMQFPSVSLGFSRISAMSECDYLTRYMTRSHLAFFLRELAPCLERTEGRAKDVLQDIVDCAYESLLNLRWQYLGVRYFNATETGSFDVRAFRDEAEEISAGYRELEKNTLALWEKYHGEIESCKDALSKKFRDAQKLFAEQAAGLSGERHGIFYFDGMLPEVYATVRARIELIYRDGEKELIYDGGLKPFTDCYDAGGMYTIRFLAKPKPAEEALFTVYGEGCLYPSGFRYLADGTKYRVAEVRRICGFVEHEEHLITPDSSFAIMGLGDGRKHLDNLTLARVENTVSVRFVKVEK